MRRLLTLTILAALILGALWLGGETLLARELRRASARDPGLDIAAVTELRRKDRVGVHLDGLRVSRAAGVLDIAAADLWLSPLTPTEARLDLPAQVIVDAGAGPVTLGLGTTDARLRLAPLGGMALDSIVLGAGPLTIARAPLADRLDLTATHSRAPQAPLPGAAGYDVSITAEKLDLERLASALTGGSPPQASLPGLLQVQAAGRIWLDARPGPANLRPEARPALVGLRIEGADLALGPLRARMIGQISADDTGHAQGHLALYTADAAPLLQLAADLGWIPQGVVKLAGQMVERLGALPIAQSAAQDGWPGITFPDPAPGELRLPLSMAQGRISLGPIPLGPAPRLR